MPLKRVTGATTATPVKLTKIVNVSHRAGAIKYKTPTPARRAHGLAKSDAEGYTGAYVHELIDKLGTNGAPSSKALLDPFLDYYGGGAPYGGQGSYNFPLQPLYPFNRLCELPLQNNVLLSLIEAYVVNIESYGYVLEYTGTPGGEDLPRVKAERAKLTAFLDFVSPERSIRDIREMSRRDYETMGNRFFECSRDLAGRIVMFDHIPGMTMRVTRRDVDATPVEMQVPDPDNPGQFKTHKTTRHFRRFMQIGPTGRRVWFKEFGDPRSIDPTSGLEDDALSVEDQATEILWLPHYVPGFIYGMPRWIGNLPAILGSRESEMVNLNFFRENAIPAMAVLVSGGALTEESFEKIKEYINSVRGAKAMNRIMVLEATADDSAGSLDHSAPSPKIDMKPMLSERQQDGLFHQFDQDNIQKIRSSMRLPPIFAGRSEDYSHATAYTSILVAESQIFEPERSSWDDMFNAKILSTWKPKYYRLKSLGPSMQDPDSLSRMLTVFGSQGALTPNVVIKLANRMLGVHIHPVVEKWGDIPFDATLNYIKKGATIDGMDEFIASLGTLQVGETEDQAVSGKPPAPAGGAAPAAGAKAKPVKAKPKAKVPVKKLDEFTLDELSDELRGELKEAVVYLAQDLRAELRDAMVFARQETVGASHGR